MKPNVEEMLDGVPIPSHLLLLGHSLRNDLVNRGFSESGRYPRPTTKAAAVVWYESAFSSQVADGIQQQIPELSQCRDVLEATGVRPLSEMQQADQSPNHLTISKTPLHPLELIQRMAANRSLCQTTNTFCSLLEILNPHANVEPVQHMVSLGCQLMMKCSQPSVTVAENR